MRIELDRQLILLGEGIHCWQIERQASSMVPEILEITKAAGSDLASLHPLAKTIFRTFLEWEIADSIADQKEYTESTDQIDQIENYYNKKLERACKEGGYQSLVVASHVFSPLHEVASLLTQFDPQTRQDLHSEIAKQVAEFHSRERNFHPLEQQLQLEPYQTLDLPLPEKDLQFLEQVQEGLTPTENPWRTIRLLAFLTRRLIDRLI